MHFGFASGAVTPGLITSILLLSASLEMRHNLSCSVLMVKSELDSSSASMVLQTKIDPSAALMSSSGVPV